MLNATINFLILLNMLDKTKLSDDMITKWVNDIEVTRTTNDINGNPRYIVHFLSLGLDEYEATNKTRRAGLTKYRGKSYGGGFVFTSYNVKHDLRYILETLHS